ncbi:uncharacterized protein LOC141633056 [Silene latifolia]|uniref:uncharacterized protein LOC141633056 n=1 Tax=Silene latifolia TaxID=37657 RepID=UPI003D77F896
MGKKQMAMRTPPKKNMEGVSFREPMETDEREESDASDDISEDTKNTDEEGGSGDGGLAEVLNKVVKMAAFLGAKKISKEERSTADDLKEKVNRANNNIHRHLTWASC